MTSKIKTKSPKFSNFSHMLFASSDDYEMPHSSAGGNKMPFYFYCCIFLCAKFRSLNFEQTLEHHMLAVLRSKKPRHTSQLIMQNWLLKIQKKNSSDSVSSESKQKQNSNSKLTYCLWRSMCVLLLCRRAQHRSCLWEGRCPGPSGSLGNPSPFWTHWKPSTCHLEGMVRMKGTEEEKAKRVRSENSVNTATPVFRHLPLKKTNFPSSLS